MHSSSPSSRIAQSLGLLSLLALLVLGLWFTRDRGQPEPDQTLVRLPVAPPESAPVTLGESLANGELAALSALLDEARTGMGIEAPPMQVEPETREEFEERYPRYQDSAIGSLLLSPQSARAADLVRAADLNQHDTQLAAAEIARLERLVSAYQGLIAKAAELRSIESNYITLQIASTDGLLSVDRLQDLINPSARELITDQAITEDPTKGEVYEQVRLSAEGRYLQEILNADVMLLHGGKGFLAPKGSVLPGLAHYDAFVEEQTLGLIYDVLEFFSRQGTVSEAQLTELLSALDVVTSKGHGSSGN